MSEPMSSLRDDHVIDSPCDILVTQQQIDAAVEAIDSLDATVRGRAGDVTVLIHYRHRRRGYCGTIIIEHGSARSARVSYSPASFRRACAAVEAAQ